MVMVALIILSRPHEHENLVNIIRFRYGKKVWLPAEVSINNKGAPLIYGEKYYLIDASQTKIYHRKGKNL